MNQTAPIMTTSDKDLDSWVIELSSEDEDAKGKPAILELPRWLTEYEPTSKIPRFPPLRFRWLEKPKLRVTLVKVWHGVRKNKHPGSIIMLDFFFEKREDQRIGTAAFNICFGADADSLSLKRRNEINEKDSSPIVVALVPDGWVNIVRKFGVKVPVELAGSVPTGASEAIKWIVEDSQRVGEKAQLSGDTQIFYWRGTETDRDTARWFTMENHGEKSGVPNYMRAAILIERADHDSDFMATADADFKIHPSDLPGQSREFYHGYMPTSDAMIFRPRGRANGGHGRAEVEVDVDDLDTCWEEAVKSTRAMGLFTLPEKKVVM